MLANLNNVFLTEEETAKQPNTISFTKSTAAATNSVQQIEETPLPYFKSILNENWYDFSFDPSLTKSDFSSIISNPFDAGFALENPYLLPSHSFNSTGFDSFENSLYLNRPKILKPLETFPCIGAQPTLFQKRAAEKIGRNIDSNSTLNCDTEDFCISENVNGSNPGDYKGRKKSVLPAKNLMAERRRRKKLNDRLYMLRSVVPKISKMDRASILGDAIEYLKELLQRINGLHDELESINSPLPTSSTSNFQPLTPTPALPCRITEELSSSRSLLSPNGQEPRVEVRLREGRAVNIHMFCARRPGLLLSTMRALDELGLDIQQAVISCFNGFALDVFRAEQSNNGPDVLPEEIKEVLLQSAGFQSTV